MIPFSPRCRLYSALRWLKQNAKGDCCFLVGTPNGPIGFEWEKPKPIYWFTQKEAL